MEQDHVSGPLKRSASSLSTPSDATATTAPPTVIAYAKPEDEHYTKNVTVSVKCRVLYVDHPTDYIYLDPSNDTYYLVHYSDCDDQLRECMGIHGEMYDGMHGDEIDRLIAEVISHMNDKWPEDLETARETDREGKKQEEQEGKEKEKDKDKPKASYKIESVKLCIPDGTNMINADMTRLHRMSIMRVKIRLGKRVATGGPEKKKRKTEGG
jgi:hypothetical protein